MALPLWLIIVIISAVVVIAAVVILIIVFSSKKRKINKKFSDAEPWIFALGEKENIKEVSATRSRLSVTLVDNEKIDKELLKKLGVSSILTMSNKVTLLIEEKAEQVAQSIQKSL